MDGSWCSPEFCRASAVRPAAPRKRIRGRSLVAVAERHHRQPHLAGHRRTLPVRALDGTTIEYGLGLHKLVTGCGTFWGHDGTVWGAGTVSLTRADGRRQMSVAVNLMRWSGVDSSGTPERHPIDDALEALYGQAMCGDGEARAGEDAGDGGLSHGAPVVALPAGGPAPRPPSPVDDAGPVGGQPPKRR
ncbi:hypothetical protein [Streptomyces thermolilacinus]|uniref:hypothetical protein n=1 Tax=Streptomyces thermolilacinus TaxID=285540 RepID=UPI0033CE6FB7